eukprot:354234-Chlamydomonas_euryale.AAC.10
MPHPKRSTSGPKAADATPNLEGVLQGDAFQAIRVKKGMDVIPEGRDNPTPSTLEARTARMLNAADTGLDDGCLVRVILPMKMALCSAREKAMGTVGTVRGGELVQVSSGNDAIRENSIPFNCPKKQISATSCLSIMGLQRVHV